jgi:hypothetical protein
VFNDYLVWAFQNQLILLVGDSVVWVGVGERKQIKTSRKRRHTAILSGNKKPGCMIKLTAPTHYAIGRQQSATATRHA